ncbi:hypothetical protein [Bartonella sp. HY761]|uniref:hypothetical protein n=1 Tax=Bartonella sp. HY761 TaxID=2979330 RepID=UPI0022096C6F|nr:hypothetical protein [Bartonella sp. HY761]UXN05841.1 hypothetical protein N6A79_11155 [Bartonella sp. HY761]
MQNILNFIKRNGISKSFVTGFIDETDGVKKFHPYYYIFYIKSGNKLFKVSINEKDLSIVVAEGKIECCFDIDEDDEFCFSSIHENLFKCEDAVRVDDIYTKRERFEKLVIEYSYGQNLKGILIADPLNFFGFTFHNDEVL